MPISAWSTDPTTNNSISVADGGMPENLTRPKDVNDVIRQQMADHKTQWLDAEWFNHGDSGIAQASSSSFTITDDVTAEYEADRRIKCYDYSTLYGTIASSSYSAPDTTVNVTLDSGSLTASLTSVALAILRPTNQSLPSVIPALTGNLTVGGTSSLSGAVVAKTSMTIEGTLTASATAVFKSLVIAEGALSVGTTFTGVGAGVFKSSLNVEGASSFSGASVFKSAVNIEGVTTLSGAAIAKSAFTAEDTFTVSGAMVAKTTGLFSGALTAGSTFTANGAAVMKSGFTAEGSATISGAFVASTTGVFNGALQASTTFTVNGATTLKTTLNVEGATTLSGAAKLNSTLTVAGNTTLSGATVLTTTLNVQGNTTLSGNAVAKGTLLIEGASTLSGATVFKTGVTIEGTLTSSATAVFKNLTFFESALQAQSTATVSGALVAKTTGLFEGALTAASTFSVSGATVLNTTLNVQGATTLSGNAVLKGTLNVEGATTLSGAAVIKGAVTITSGSITGITDLAIADGGTGQSSKTTAFDALSPLTTIGDLIGFDSTNNVRIARGTDYYYLAYDPGAAAYINSFKPSVEWKTTQTASSSSSLVFTNISAGGQSWSFFISQIIPSTDNVSFLFRTSTNGGSSYDSSAGNYQYMGDSVTTAGTRAAFNSSSATSIILCTGAGSGSNEAINGTVWMYRPQDSKYCMINWILTQTDQSSATGKVYYGGGFRASAADVDAVQFIMSSGNIASGSINAVDFVA